MAWVDAGKIITSARVSAGVDISLLIPAKLCVPDIARATARDIEYDYWEHTIGELLGGAPGLVSG